MKEKNEPEKGDYLDIRYEFEPETGSWIVYRYEVVDADEWQHMLLLKRKEVRKEVADDGIPT